MLDSGSRVLGFAGLSPIRPWILTTARRFLHVCCSLPCTVYLYPLQGVGFGVWVVSGLGLHL